MNESALNAALRKFGQRVYALVTLLFLALSGTVLFYLIGV